MSEISFRNPAAKLSSSIKPFKTLGKNLGLVATENILTKYSTILIEKPILQWNSESYQTLLQLKAILPLNKELLILLDQFFPISLCQIQPNILKQSRKLLERNLLLGEDENTNLKILRVYFVLECNSFPSGLCLNLALCNHSCYPNSEVAEFTDETTGEIYYHLITTRDIKAGEEITISYLERYVLIEKCTSRRRILEGQYGFECHCELCSTTKLESFKCKSCFAEVDYLNATCLSCGVKFNLNWLDKLDSKLIKNIEKLRNTIKEIEMISPTFKFDVLINYKSLNKEDRYKLRLLLEHLVAIGVELDKFMYKDSLILEIVR
ncbi:hypothetical protein HDU92_007178 [Lobulomyces angularis]|nr:hypothetical protein HDU92_007178 [Lobulomyces angularis]